MSLTLDDLVGKRLDLLGRVQQVAFGDSATTLIFPTNDTDFRGQKIAVVFVTVELITATPVANGYTYKVVAGTFDPGVGMLLGSSGSNDWAQNPLLPLAPVTIGGEDSPVVLRVQQNETSIGMPTYGPGVPFTTTDAGVSSTQLCQVSAWGWASG